MTTDLLPRFDTQLFSDIFPDLENWLTFMNDTDFTTLTSVISEDNQKILYYLLLARYGNNPISNLSENQFYYKIASTIFKFGPSWQKRLELQNKLRNLTDDELLTGAKVIYNQAFGNNNSPTTNTTDELLFINNQNVNKNVRGKVEAYATLMEVLKNDVSEVFIAQFKDCFNPFAISSRPTLYITDEEEED